MKASVISKCVSRCCSLSLFVAIVVCFQNGVVGEKSYKLNLQKLVGKSDETFANFSGVRVYKYNRSVSALNGSFEIFMDVPDTVLLEVRGYEKIGNEYVLSGIQFKEDLFCSQVLKYKDVIFFPEYNDTTNLMLKCPITKGVYYIKNYRPENHALPDNVPGHFWRFDVIARYPEHIDKYLFHLQAFMEIERVVSGHNPLSG